MKRFYINQEYTCKSICDSEAIFKFIITDRTQKTVKINEKRFKVFFDKDGSEFIYPTGKYSMCLVLRA